MRLARTRDNNNLKLARRQPISFALSFEASILWCDNDAAKPCTPRFLHEYWLKYWTRITLLLAGFLLLHALARFKCLQFQRVVDPFLDFVTGPFSVNSLWRQFRSSCLNHRSTFLYSSCCSRPNNPRLPARLLGVYNHLGLNGVCFECFLRSQGASRKQLKLDKWQ